jgi:hypothetical protein
MIARRSRGATRAPDLPAARSLVEATNLVPRGRREVLDPDRPRRQTSGHRLKGAVHRMLRNMLFALAALLVFAAGSLRAVSAQEASPAFSSTLLSGLGYPEIVLTETGTGYEEVPTELPAGRYLVSLTAPETHFAYVNFVQVPAGLSDDDAQAQLLSAALDDVPVEGWTYGGGSFAFEGTTVHFVIDLEAGEWQIGSTRQDITSETSEETALLYPLTVTPSDEATAGGEPEVAPSVEMQDVAWGGLEGPLPAGPQIWKITNTGEQPRQMVLWRTPRLITVDDMEEIFAPWLTGTPPAEDGLYSQFVWVGYAAILSPGQTVWLEFDLAPETYAVMSYVIDPETQLPAAMLGMVQGFEVA